jgi:hypothetical protein
MAITSYATLVTAVNDRLARPGTTATVSQEVITSAEGDIKTRLRTLDMATRRASFTLVGEFTPVPSDFLQVKSFWLNTSPRTQLEFLPDDSFGTATSGKPRFFNLVGNEFRVYPASDGSYTATLIYFADIPALSSTVPTNWLLTKHPNVYLYGACFHLAIQIQDAEKSQYYGMLFDKAIEQVKSHSNMSRWAGPGMAVRVA